jgi:prepilin-type processing-associated H-X9-DG protein
LRGGDNGRRAIARRMADATTLVELLVVMAVIAVLAGLAAPALMAGKRKAKMTACLNSQMELVRAWQVYLADSSDGLPPNGYQYDEGVYRSEVNSWLGDNNAQLDTNSDAIKRGIFYRYHYNNSLAVYRCPSDLSRVAGDGAAGAPRLFRTRSYSMSGTFGGQKNALQTVYQKFSDTASPSKFFVFLDENEDGIDDGHFRTWPGPLHRWVNMPTDRHGQGGSFSFADGHVELWRWRWPKQFHINHGYWKDTENAADLADLQRLQGAVPPPPPGWQVPD